MGALKPGTATRGEVGDDNCASFDFYSGPNTLSSALWSEESCECVSTTGTTCAVQFSDAGNACLKDKTLSVTEMLASNEVFVGKQVPNVVNCNVLSALQNAEGLTRTDGAPVEDVSGAPLVALVALLLSHAVTTGAVSGSDEGKEKKTKGSKKSRRTKQRPVTLVVPAGFTQTQRAVLVNAAERSSLSIRNLFNRGVSTVAGMLYAASRVQAQTGGPPDIFDALHLRAGPTGNNSTDASHIVLYLNVYELPGAGATSFDAVLVSCDGQRGALQTGSPLRFERLCSLAALGGALKPFAEEAASLQLQQITTQLLSAAQGPTVSAIVLGGLLAQKQTHFKEDWTDQFTRSLLGLSIEVGVVRASVGDAVCGACVLSAAELDSSKQYMQLADGTCKIGYIVRKILLASDVGPKCSY